MDMDSLLNDLKIIHICKPTHVHLMLELWLGLIVELRTDFSPAKIGIWEDMGRYSKVDTHNPSCQGLRESIKLKSSREEK